MSRHLRAVRDDERSGTTFAVPAAIEAATRVLEAWQVMRRTAGDRERTLQVIPLGPDIFEAYWIDDSGAFAFQYSADAVLAAAAAGLLTPSAGLDRVAIV